MGASDAWRQIGFLRSAVSTRAILPDGSKKEAQSGIATLLIPDIETGLMTPALMVADTDQNGVLVPLGWEDVGEIVKMLGELVKAAMDDIEATQLPGHVEAWLRRMAEGKEG